MSARIRINKNGEQGYRTVADKNLAISEADRARIAHEQTRAIMIEMRRLCIRLVHSIENTYGLRESDLKSE